ncbi:hypothetical protein C8Q76DRAFT_817206 [Earliella scabrosa]|nr:hypothetical protein C8Q76DRAFT_817206 [Earliella scabrosa]
MATPYYDIYAKELSRYKLGHPLWCPDPDPSFGAVRLGDVGFLESGHFRFLFNAIDPSLNQRGNPPNFVKLTIPDEWHSKQEIKDFITMPTMYGSSIQSLSISPGASLNGGPIGLGASWEFECDRAAGAFLLLKGHGHRTNLDCGLHIKNYISDNLANWYTFANDTLGIGLRDEEIVFVSGFTKTAVWAAASFSHDSVDKAVKLSGSCSLPGAASGSVQLAVQMSDSHGVAIDTRVGPPELASQWEQLSPEQLTGADQCIFLEYYRMRRRLVFLKTIVAAAGPHELPPPDPPVTANPAMSSFEELIVSEQACVDHDCPDVGHAQEPYDLLDCLLDYMLEHTGADIAIASYVDVASPMRLPGLHDNKGYDQHTPTEQLASSHHGKR